ncbi:shikimate 5-dehydrogenase [compost metagenome]
MEDAPNIPYEYIGNKHLLYDLVYNPAETAFLKKGKNNGAKIKNGLEMLELQAEKNWEIWNEL